MKIQKVFTFKRYTTCLTDPEPRILANFDQYTEPDKDMNFSLLPRWSGRGRFPEAPVFAKACAKKDCYYQHEHGNMFHLYIEETFLANLASKVDLWCYDEFEVYKFYYLDFATVRVPLALSDFIIDDQLLAKHILYRIIHTYKSHPLYTLQAYAEASLFYHGIDMLLQEGKFMLTSFKSDYFVYSNVSVPLVREIQIQIREEVLRKYGLHKENREIVFNGEEIREKL